MNILNRTPFVLFAFANEDDAHLPLLRSEAKRTNRALRDACVQGVIGVVREEGADIDELSETLRAYSDHVSVFHYGAHADGAYLHLVEDSGQAAGLVALLGTAPQMQLVFLNGCATRGQVRALLDAGVPSVIATSVPVEDPKASEFASRFYEALGDGSTIGEAFEAASTFLKLNYGPEPASEFRGRVPQGDAGDLLPWGLYSEPSGQAALGWRLPSLVPETASDEGTLFGGMRRRFLDRRLGALTAITVLGLGAVAGVLSNLEQIRQLVAPRYDLAIANSIPAEVGEFDEVPLQLEVLLSGNAGAIVDDATVSLEILDAAGLPLDSAARFRAFVLPTQPIVVPPLSPEAPRRLVELAIGAQLPGEYTVIARVSAGRRSSQTQSRIAVLPREFTAYRNAAPPDAPLLLLIGGVATSEVPITDVPLFRVLLLEHVAELGLFNSTLWFEPTYIGAAGGATWAINRVNWLADNSFERQRFMAAMREPHDHIERLDFVTAFSRNQAMVPVGDYWYELTIVDAERIAFSRREASCATVDGVVAGSGSEGDIWVFEEADIEVVQGPVDCGATGRICSQAHRVNGEWYTTQENINEAGHQYFDAFPLRFDLSGGRYAKVSVNPLGVELCSPP